MAEPKVSGKVKVDETDSDAVVKEALASGKQSGVSEVKVVEPVEVAAEPTPEPEVVAAPVSADGDPSIDDINARLTALEERMS